MKRRTFIETGVAGALGISMAGCSSVGGSVNVKQELTPVDFEKKLPKPQGDMPMDVIGKTGIKVSKFGFGSHIRDEVKTHVKEREWMVREAFDLGVNLFDVYDFEGGSFQYEPMGRYMQPFIKDAVVSITIWPYDGRNIEQELERDLRLFNRDYIDLVRIHAWRNTEDSALLKDQLGHRWDWWEQLFKLKEKGYIRAVGVPVHRREDLKEPLELPLDFVILPYNFYHNWTWAAKKPDSFDTMIPQLRERGIGIISMKPFAGDSLAVPLKKLGAEFDKTGEFNYTQACLRYVIDSDLKPATTLCGMYSPYHLYENIDAFFKPGFSDNEKNILKKIREKAKVVALDYLPEHYRFLEEWVPDSWDNSDLFG
jgi:predicted aldo/keto reductase-like oxidoreductase